MAQLRQLAAIMFTDIAGYTALMGDDEQKAFDLLDKNRALHRPLIEKHGGRWIKEIGDSILCSFSSVFDAVSCARIIQEASSGIPGLQLRVGIHLGDIVFENNDVFGDGVNIASRLQVLCKAGCIFISEAVYNSLANKKGFDTRFHGEESLKNVKDRIRVYEVLLTAPQTTTTYSQPKSVPDPHNSAKAPPKSIAVLPFVNMSNDPEQEYFSDGIAEEILNSLTHIKDLKIAGRTSSFQFKGKNVDMREIGEKLNVRTVLEGSVRKQGNRLRITTQLVSVADGYHLWSERYDRDMTDIFAIQDEIALAITEKLKITLMENEKEAIQKSPTDDHEAYDLYLKGRFYLNKRGSGIRKALEYFQQAVDKDPGFALAYTGITDVYCILALYSSIPAKVGMPKARENAEKAIEADSSLTEAYSALAFISTFFDWNWDEAKSRYKNVFERSMKYAPAHYWYSYYLSFVEGRLEDAIEEARRAERLEPLEPVSHHIISMMQYNAGKFDEGANSSRTAIELDNNFFPAYRSLGLNLSELGRLPEAVDAIEKAAVLSMRHPITLVELCWIYKLSNHHKDVMEIYNEFNRRSSTEFISSMYRGCVAYFSGHEDEALEWIEKSFNERDSTFPCINQYKLFYFFREDPRFRSYIGKMHFPG